jgi:hypothetical protein
MTQQRAVAAADIGDKPSSGEVVGCRNRRMPIVGEVRHHRIEEARFIGVGAEILKPAHAPGGLVRHPTRQRHVQSFPRSPWSRCSPESRGVVQAVRRGGAQQAGARRVRDGAVGRDGEDAEASKRLEHAQQRLGLHAAVSRQVNYCHAAVGRDPVGDAEVGHEAEHTGDLESPQ